MAARGAGAAAVDAGDRFIYSASPDPVAHRLRAFRQGLKEYDYVEGENCVIVYRWAESQNDRLAEMVTDLTRREVSVITAMSTIAAAAKAANTTIPIIFRPPKTLCGLVLSKVCRDPVATQRESIFSSLN